jgi:hypothetical protein
MNSQTPAIQNFRQSPAIGCPVHIPIEHEDQVALMLRTVIAMAEQDDSKNIIMEGESYETVCRKLLALSAYLQELAEVAHSIIKK